MKNLLPYIDIWERGDHLWELHPSGDKPLFSIQNIQDAQRAEDMVETDGRSCDCSGQYFIVNWRGRTIYPREGE